MPRAARRSSRAPRESLRDRRSPGPSGREGTDPGVRARPRRWRAVTPQRSVSRAEHPFPSSRRSVVECVSVRVVVPKETDAGERRVALIPDSVGRLVVAGFTIGVENGAGLAAGFTDAEYAAAGADVVARAEVLRGSRAPSSASAGRLRRRSRSSQPGTVLDRLSLAAHRSGGNRTTRGTRRRRVRDGVDPADHARTVDGRALLAGERGRLQGDADRGRPAAEVLPTPDDRGRDGRPGKGARGRRRRRRAPGDRDGAPARSRRHRVRRSAGRPGAGREPRRDLPGPRSPWRRDGRRLRAASSRTRSRRRQQDALAEQIPDSSTP